MFPILAIGAAIFGAFAVKEAVDASQTSDTHGTARGGRAQRESAPLPQESYLVTPITNSTSSGQPISALEAVRNFIV